MIKIFRLLTSSDTRTERRGIQQGQLSVFYDSLYMSVHSISENRFRLLITTCNNPYRHRRIDLVVRFPSHIRARNCETERDSPFQLSSQLRVNKHLDYIRNKF
jgi:hypothetical protein